MDQSMRRAAREGNVSDLYRLIKKDGNVLKRFEKVEFIDTPLHIAAGAGCFDFAMEIMSLRPSFARKLNQEGLSPIHLAMEKGHTELVLNLMENAKDLVRVKGKKGETPLHYVITREENSEAPLLSRILEDCPESIRDMTIEKKTALHIAVGNNKQVAVEILCKMLRKIDYCEDVVNQKDKNGDTALHIAGRDNRFKMINLLLKCKADKHATNLDGKTALDVAQQLNNEESIQILRGFFIPSVSTFIDKLQKQIIMYVTKASWVIFHDMDNISSDDRNALLVVLGLLLTASFQASLSPPGSVWQGDSSSISAANGGGEDQVVGKSVMNQIDFFLFFIPASAVFIVAFSLTLGLLKPFPRGFRTALQVLLAFLAICFCESIIHLAPTYLAALVINLVLAFVFILMMFMCFAYQMSKISVLILGWAVFPLGGLVMVLVLFIFLYDEFWKGFALVVVYCLIFLWATKILIIPILVLGFWLFLHLCRFCIKRFCKCSTVK